MGNLQRRRTRGQWEEFYKNVAKTLKKKKSRGGRNGGVTRNVVDPESISLGEQDFVLISVNGLDVHEDLDRTRGIKCGAGSGGIKGNGVEEDRTGNVASAGRVLRGKRAEKDVDDYVASAGGVLRERRIEKDGDGNVASGGQVLRGKRTYKDIVGNVASRGRVSREKRDSEIVKDKKFEDVDAFVFLGEKVSSDVSSVRIPTPESGFGSKADNCSNNVDSCNFDDNERRDDEDRCVSYDSQSGNSVPDSLGSDRMADYSDSGHSVPDSLGSNKNDDDSSLSGSSSNEDCDNDDPSDADYKESEQSSSEDTNVLYVSEKDDEYKSEDDGNGGLLNVEEKKNPASKIDDSSKNGKQDVDFSLDDDESVEGYDGDDDINTPTKSVSQQDREHIVGKNRPRFSGKKESSEIMQEKVEIGDELCHGYEIRDSNGQNEDTVFFVDLEKKMPNVITSDSKKRKFGSLEILVDFDNNSDDIIERKHLRQFPVSNSQNKEASKSGKFSDEAEPFMYIHKESMLKRNHQSSWDWKKKSPDARKIDLIKMLVHSIESMRDQVARVEVNHLVQNSLPLKFKFDDDVEQPTTEKSESEKEIESLFLDLELGLQQAEIEDASNCAMAENDDITPKEIDDSPEARCDRGEHQPILDEQIGVKCQHCHAVILEIKHVLPPFFVRSLRRQERGYFDESPSPVIDDGFQFHDPACGPRSDPPLSRAKGTVWDLIPGVEKDLFPHQREGFEFIWKNIVGGIIIDELKQTLTDDDGRGCIISHTPGTGKSRLAIVFLTAFMKLYPNCRPVIIAPKGMLLTWEEEFKKWKVDIAFHNMNNAELSGNETRIAAELARQVGNGAVHKECNRLVKLYSWMTGGGVLGISYTLFEKLTGENKKEGCENEQKILRNIILAKTGLLVLDEGHTPRNEKSLIWKALTDVATQRRIILSGTPFQNNFTELKNTLCLVHPKFVSERKWKALTNSIAEDRDGVMKLRAMLDPFVHLHEGTILQKSLPGLRDTIVFLRPTDLQKSLLEVAIKDKNHLRSIHLVSLVSVHPSMVAKAKIFPAHKEKLEEIDQSDIDEGVKMKFVMNIVKLAASVGERVLIFGQYIDPLNFIKKQLKSHLGWNEGREVLYMDGNLKEKLRQESISSFNNHLSDAKVLLASERACSEGINLVGASRIVLLDTVWNPSVERQAISRAYRLGQKKVVHVYRLIISGTEIRQYELQAKKDLLSQLIFSRGNDEDTPCAVVDDKVLEAMAGLDIFEKIIHQPKESDLIETFGFEDL